MSTLKQEIAQHRSLLATEIVVGGIYETRFGVVEIKRDAMFADQGRISVHNDLCNKKGSPNGKPESSLLSRRERELRSSCRRPSFEPPFRAVDAFIDVWMDAAQLVLAALRDFIAPLRYRRTRNAELVADLLHRTEHGH